jgi:hypothetical protein
LAIPSQTVDDSLGFAGGVPSSLTPGRTGLSGKAFRVPSRLANTPGAAKTHGAAAPQTKFHGILKKLQFSGVPTSQPEEKPAPIAAAVAVPTTTTKRLQFEFSHTNHQSHETPLGATFYATTASGATSAVTTAVATTTEGGLPGGFKSSMRKVTFGGNTVSPSHNPPRRSSIMVGFQTPSAIAEGASGDEDDNDEEDEDNEERAIAGGNGTVNSRNAGATPFDRRLSALLFKYDEGKSSPAAAEEMIIANDVANINDGSTPVNNDLWKKLFSISPTESIKALSSPSANNKCFEGKEQNINKECEGDGSGNDSSLEIMSLANGTPVVLIEANDAVAAIEDNNIKEKDTIDASDVSPNTAVASVLGVLLRRSLEDIKASKAAEAAAAPRSLPSSRDAISPTSGILSMLPVAIPNSGSTAMTPPPPAARSLTPMSIDGVLRDEDGIPLATPSSVTLFRGAAQASRRNDDDGVPADLFRTFNTPPEVVVVAPVEEEVAALNREPAPAAAAAEDFAFSLPGSVRNHHHHHQAEAATTPPASVTTAANTPGAFSDTASDGTPDLKLKHGGGTTGAKSGRHGASPFRFTPTPSSTRKITMATSFGKAQRVPTPTRSPAASEINQTSSEQEQLAIADLVPPPSLTKELRGLLKGMSLATPGANTTAVTLSPSRASPLQQRELGVQTVVTPVRRSPRFAPGGDVSSSTNEMLEAAGFVYVPNPALSTGKNGASGSRATAASPGGAKKEGQRAAPVAVAPVTDENSGITPVSRYGLRSASKSTNTKSKTAANKPGSGDKALGLSPTEQNIRDSLRRSSRRKSTATPTSSDS